MNKDTEDHFKVLRAFKSIQTLARGMKKELGFSLGNQIIV